MAEVTARDYYGNLAQASVSFYIDSIPPATQLVALGTYTVQGSLIISQAGSSLTLTAQDPVVDGYSTGVSNTYYLVGFSTPGLAPGELFPPAPVPSLPCRLFWPQGPIPFIMPRAIRQGT